MTTIAFELESGNPIIFFRPILGTALIEQEQGLYTFIVEDKEYRIKYNGTAEKLCAEIMDFNIRVRQVIADFDREAKEGDVFGALALVVSVRSTRFLTTEECYNIATMLFDGKTKTKDVYKYINSCRFAQK